MGFLARRRQRRLERMAEKYGNLSPEERAQLEDLREQHDPLKSMARVRGGGAWNRMIESEFKPPRR
jgi:hypothetical protein